MKPQTFKQIDREIQQYKDAVKNAGSVGRFALYAHSEIARLQRERADLIGKKEVQS